MANASPSHSSAGKKSAKSDNHRAAQTLFLAGVLIVGAGVAGYIVLAETTTPAIPFDGAAAYGYLKQLCDIGPRMSGSPGMTAQQKLLTDHFEKLGAKVKRQEFKARDPLTGNAVPMTNLLVQWHPDRKERVLLCAHYDTRPFPDRDRRNPKGKFVGANDGASGVALLMELGKSMPALQSSYGVDFLLVDGEDLVYWDNAAQKDTGSYCVGSEYFARQYVADPPPYKYRWAVLFDMVGGTILRLPKEGHGVSWPDTKPLVDQIWDTAARLKVREFIPRVEGEVTDDHVMLHDLGQIPAIDLICDFGAYTSYPQWHTQDDDPAHCSPVSLAKVGWVIEEWLKSLK